MSASSLMHLLTIPGDTTDCDHRKTIVPAAAQQPPASPEWTHGDDQVSFFGLMEGPSFKRRKSGDSPVTGAARTHSRRWPSITKRWSDRKATTSLSSPTVRSAPPSRSSSLQSPSLQRSLASHLGQHDPLTPPATPARSRTTSITRAKGPPEPLDINASERAEDPPDREEQSTTPLLPPVMTSLRRQDEEEEVQSPLESPSVAPGSACASASHTSLSSPTAPPAATPNLSTKTSIASLAIGHTRAPTSQDISAMSISTETDPWASRLGHANFTVYPEPYRPEICDHKACSALLESWELARSRYMRHASCITENYGPTSQTFKYTEQKWAEIDATWRRNLDDANAQAEANGEAPAAQSLAETQPVSRIPTLNDPHQPNKFPEISDDDIVGPMVQYARATDKPAKKSILLKLLASPAALLSRRRPTV